MLRAIAGLETLDAGAISWNGSDLARVPVHKRGFALMFQDGQLFPHRSVGENIAYSLTRRLSKPAIAERVAELLHLVDLAGFGDRRVTSLSGGEQQRVALARALAAEPRLLLLDEPLSSLDRELRERLAGDLRQILASTGTTTIFVTHDQSEALAIATRVGVMAAGHLVQLGDASDVWRHPADASTAGFLGYSSVLTTAAPLGVAPFAGELALRPEALVVAENGPIHAAVLSDSPTISGARLRVLVEGLGTLEAVSLGEQRFAAGHPVRLRLDETATARIPVAP
jgi:thiamine transport system ATP-binding protein